MKYLLDKIKGDIQIRLDKINNKFSIAHILPELESQHQSRNLIKMGYNETVGNICDELGINVYQEFIKSSPYELYRDVKNVIEKYNNIPNINGIMYDCPFIHDNFENTIQVLITERKDIECITPINIGRYMTRQQYETLPPITTSISMLMSKYTPPSMKRIGIIQSANKFNCKFIPNTNIDNDTYIISTIKDDTFIDLDISSLDVIISCLYNGYKQIDKETMSWAGDINASLVIDYGWRSVSFVPSIDNKIFRESTVHLTLYDGLIELYVYNAIKNMIRLYEASI